jgi:hypothetical protein
LSGKSTFLKFESLTAHGLEGGLKAFKSFLKDKKGNTENKTALCPR